MEIFIIQQAEFHEKSYPYCTLKPVKYGKNKGKKGAYHAQCRRIFHENAWFFECKMIPKRFSLSGSAESRCIETVKFYLALRRAGYPDWQRTLSDADVERAIAILNRDNKAVIEEQF